MKNVENCTQDDGYNCGVFTLLMMMMRHKGEMGHLHRHYTSDELMECRLRIFYLINDIFKVIIPNNKFFYDWEKHGVTNNYRKWTKIFLDSLLPGYNHDKRREFMRKMQFQLPDLKVNHFQMKIMTMTIEPSL